MPIYEYKNEKTGEIITKLRSIKERDNPVVLEDGTVCTRIISNFGGWRKDREVFEVDPHYIKKMNPKYVRFRDGHRELYSPDKHN